MILDEITLHNFGVYAGRQSLTLTPEPGRPVILVGGLNGGGKTTLLDALQLALYGKLARCSNRGALPYEEYLRRSISRTVSPSEGAELAIRLRHKSEGETHTYDISRRWSATAATIREQVEVLRDGAYDRVLTEAWQEQVDEFIPSQLSHLFFFDGEKIEALANWESSSALLGSAIQSLLGLDLVERLAGDLSILERRRQAAMPHSTGEADEPKYRRELGRIEARRDEISQALAANQNKLDALSGQLHATELQFTAQGGRLVERKAELLRQRESLARDLDRVEQQLRALAAAHAPFLLVGSLLHALVERDKREHAALEGELFAYVLEARDRALLAFLEQLQPSEALRSAVEEFLDADRLRRRTEVVGGLHLRLGADARTQAQSLVHSLLPEARVRGVELLTQEEDIQRRLVDLERTLTRIPDPDTVAGLVGELEQLRRGHQEATRQRQELTAEYELLQREHQILEERWNRSVMADLEQRIAQEEQARIVHHARKVRATLEAFRVSVTERHVMRIESFVLDCLQKLLRKDNLIGRLRIDPRSYALTLFDDDGREIVPDRLSAGERQLLAVSLLWGLSRASGRPLPAVIDTPLGRLDSVHRRHLVERYFPYASHQVLLLSTDEEIDGAYHDSLSRWMARQYHLAFDRDSGTTQVRPGYFAERS